MGLDPGTLAMLAQGVTAGAGVANTGLQANAQRQEGRYLGRMAQENAAMAELEAKDAEQRGARDASERMKATRQLIARQRVAAAGQGIEADSGTAALIQEETAGIGALEAEAIRNNAWREAWGLRSEARQYRHSGRNARARGKAASGQTAATGGLQFANDLMAMQKIDDYYRKPPPGPPAGKNMSDPRNR